jgi:hypothetical protein
MLRHLVNPPLTMDLRKEKMEGLWFRTQEALEKDIEIKGAMSGVQLGLGVRLMAGLIGMYNSQGRTKMVILMKTYTPEVEKENEEYSSY